MIARFQQLITLAVCLGVASPAKAAPSVLESEDAKAHFAKAQEYFDAEDYASAIPELKAAYAAEPNPMLLYAWAQAERLEGNCGKAIELYKRFLEADPPKKSADLARANIVDCETEAGPPPPPPVAGDPDPGTGESPGADPVDDGSSHPDKPWHRDWIGGTLLGVGGATALAGGIVVGLSYGQVNSSPDAPTEGDYFAEVDTARRMNLAGWVVLGAGGALIVGGIVRFAVLGARHKQQKSAVGVLPGRSGATLMLTTRF